MELSLGEILIIAVAAVLFIGPKELPAVIRAAAKGLRGVRAFYNEVRKGFDDLARESGLSDTADALNTDMRLIKGDDGKLYESYDITHFPAGTKRGE